MALILTIFGTGWAALYFSDNYWAGSFVGFGLSLVILLCCWGMLRIGLEMERQRKLARLLRSYDLRELAVADGESFTSAQCAKENDPDCSNIQSGAPPPDSPITRR